MPSNTIRIRLAHNYGLQIEVLHHSKTFEFLPNGTRFRAWQIEPKESNDEFAHYQLYQLLDEHALAAAFGGMEMDLKIIAKKPANLEAYEDAQKVYDGYIRGRYILDTTDTPPSWLSGSEE